MSATVERALVGDCLLKSSVIPDVRRRVPSGSVFVDEEAGKLYDIILAVYDEHGGIDAAFLSEKCKAANLHPSILTEYGEDGYPPMCESHAVVVSERLAVRRVIPELRDLADQLSLGEVNVRKAADEAIEHLQNLKTSLTHETVKTAVDVALDTTEKLDGIFSGTNSGSVSFGFEDIDRVTGGMFPGNLIVIAAKEKSGKSTMQNQIAYGEAEKRGTPVLIISLEMKAWEILLRMACIDCNLRVIDVLRNKLSPDQQRRLILRIDELSRLPVFIRDAAVTITDIQADAERLVRTKGIKLICVDYIQRVIPKSTKGENREREVAAISSGLKTLALDLDVPVLALSQVNEDFRARESRAIEQDMDKLILIGERPELRDGQTGIVVPLQIRQRMGLSTEMGDLHLYYDLRHGTWASSYNVPIVPAGKPQWFPVTSEHDND